MIRNETKPGGADDREKYESAVLDFLDKEMASNKPVQKQNQQTEELDALVSDLLKQVITESDQPKKVKDILIDEEDELFSGVKPKDQVQEAKPNKPVEAAPPKAPVVAGAAKSADKSDKKVKAQANAKVAVESKPAATKSVVAPGLFASKPEVAQKKPPIMAIAGVAAVVVIGAGIYFFTGSSNEPAKPPVTKPPVTAAAPVVTAPVAPTPVEPVSKTGKNGSPRVQPTAPVQSQPAPHERVATPAPAPVQSQPTPPVQEAANRAPVISNPAPVQPTPPPAAPPVHEAAPTPPPVVERPTPPPAAPVQPADSTPAAPLMASVSSSDSQPDASVPKVAAKTIGATLVSTQKPVYPELAIRSRTSGTVVLDLQIDTNGKVTRATPVSGPILLRDAAVNAAMKYRYKPASTGGLNVASQARVSMVFNLR